MMTLMMKMKMKMKMKMIKFDDVGYLVMKVIESYNSQTAAKVMKSLNLLKANFTDLTIIASSAEERK